MNKRNVVIALALAAALLTFAGCDKNEGNGQNSESVSPSTETESEPSLTTVASETEKTDTIIITDSTTDSITEPEETTAAATTEPAHSPTGDTAAETVRTAASLLGIPFASNGVSPDTGFDNSGFIYYVLRENGFINCPRLTNEQAAMGTVIGYNELKSGDLAFFCTADSGNPDFGGIYIGDGKMIYCPMPGQTVKEEDISADYWKRVFVSGVRLS